MKVFLLAIRARTASSAELRMGELKGYGFRSIVETNSNQL